MTPIRTAARTLLGTLFVGSGVLALRHSDQLAGKAKPVADQLGPALEAAGLPTDPETLVKVNGAVQVAGGLLLATGYFTRPAAAALAASVVPSTIAAHPFWTEHDPQRRAEQQVQFAKNLGLLGGLLFAAVDRGGKPSLAWRARYAARDARRSARYAARDARRSARQAAATAGLTGALAAKEAGGIARRAGDKANQAGRSVRRGARTARREARLVMRAARFGRSLPF